jgi:PhnB protein
MANLSLSPYLFFDGQCREALTFYASCLGGEPQFMTYGSTQGEGCPAGLKERIIHGSLATRGAMLMASDTDDAPPVRGSNVHLSLQCGVDEIDALANALAEGGKITMAVHDAFWGDRFGTLVDRFGVLWMLNAAKQ